MVFTVLIPLAAYVAKVWDEAAAHEKDARLRAVQNQLSEAEKSAAFWKLRMQFFVHLNSVINELVLDKSVGYVEAMNATDATTRQKHLEGHDNLSRNVQRIIALFYRFLAGYADLPEGKQFQVAFFATNPQSRHLVLKAVLNSEGQPPKSVGLDKTNEHLSKDGDSIASHAWRIQQTVIIPDTITELAQPQPRFVSFYHGQEREIRSIIAYPVIDRVVPLAGGDPCIGVICADCRVENGFTQDQAVDLNYLFDTFGRRIVFEVRRWNCIQRQGA